MRERPPKLTVLARRLLSALRDIGKALQEQNEVIAGAQRAESTKQTVPQEMRAEVHLPQGIETRKSASDAKEDGKYQRLTLLVSGLTLLAIIIYAILVYFQWTEMIAATDATQQAVHEARLSRQQAQKSLNATIDQFRSEQRPYVWTISNGVGSPEFVPSRQPNSRTGQVTWTWHYTNYGKTSAYNVRFRHFISLDGGPFVESYGATRQGSFGPPLPPTQDVIAEVISGPGVTPEQWTHATSLGGQGISIRMKIEYTDAYGVMYETGICLNRLNTGAISFCREGNYIK